MHLLATIVQRIVAGSIHDHGLQFPDHNYHHDDHQYDNDIHHQYDDHAPALHGNMHMGVHLDRHMGLGFVLLHRRRMRMRLSGIPVPSRTIHQRRMYDGRNDHLDHNDDHHLHDHHGGGRDGVPLVVRRRLIISVLPDSADGLHDPGYRRSLRHLWRMCRGQSRTHSGPVTVPRLLTTGKLNV